MAKKPRAEAPGLIARLKDAIRGCGLSLNKLAKEADISNDQLSRFMRDERTLTLPIAEKVCQALGLDLLPTGSTPPPDAPPAKPPASKGGRPLKPKPARNGD